tara:strand:+ start:30 stop:173 length:144 start_codon:yes stop_codon:yes gene_type:complete
MKIYVKENGTELEVNPNSYDAAEKLGWKVKPAKAAPKTKAKAKPKAE